MTGRYKTILADKTIYKLGHTSLRNHTIKQTRARDNNYDYHNAMNSDEL